jgi:hypothetical protein
MWYGTRLTLLLLGNSVSFLVAAVRFPTTRAAATIKSLEASECVEHATEMDVRLRGTRPPQAEHKNTP